MYTDYSTGITYLNKEQYIQLRAVVKRQLNQTRREKMKNFISTINRNKGIIIRRTAIVAVGVIAVTLATGLIKVGPTDKAAEVAGKAASAVKKAAENS